MNSISSLINSIYYDMSHFHFLFKDNLDKKVCIASSVVSLLMTDIENTNESYVIGIGSGTTSMVFLYVLMKNLICLDVQRMPFFVMSSTSMMNLFSHISSIHLDSMYKYKCLDNSYVGSLPVMVDGADRIDDTLCSIKGLGGALFREKMLALASKKRIIMASRDKYVTQDNLFSQCILPIEIDTFSYLDTIKRIDNIFQSRKISFYRELRFNHDKNIFITDNNRYIVEYFIENSPSNNDPQEISQVINSIHGVVENGIFDNAHYLFLEDDVISLYHD